MKKVLLIIALAILASCSKSTTNPKNKKPSILGKWNMVKYVWIDSSQDFYNRDTTPYLQDSYAIFSKDGNIYSYSGEEVGYFSFDTLPYKIDGSTIYLFHPGDSLDAPQIDTGYIETLTDTSLILYGGIDRYMTSNGLPATIREWDFLNR